MVAFAAVVAWPPAKVRTPSAVSPVTAAPLTVMLLSPAFADPNPRFPPLAPATVVGLTTSVASAAVAPKPNVITPFVLSPPAATPPFATSVAWSAVAENCMRRTASENKSEGPFTVTVALLRVPPNMSKAIPFEEIVKVAFPALGVSKKVMRPPPLPCPKVNVPLAAVESLWKSIPPSVKTP